ncbi:hypothetical protein K466DRAFT_569600 [Polyporus arcularius HHB13444]|uniref:Uncharacterized protein n=1 Tax=Polyporus arcularius HHB13444 TaxID=1314778 RepID=A0A5C3P418_9APHY|nr:hypothetical protein K466DRAFT_569600 [Polyporus arcularius HHB13444]
MKHCWRASRLFSPSSSLPCALLPSSPLQCHITSARRYAAWMTQNIQGWLMTSVMSDVPVATDDEGTVREPQETAERGYVGQQSPIDDSLPPSSPIESWTDDEGVGAQGQTADNREGSTTSYDTKAMWASAGPVPELYLFDGHEAAPREEGEVEDEEPHAAGEDRTSDEMDEASRAIQNKVNEYLCKHPTGPGLEGCMTTPRKRSWNGTVASEELSRFTRRPRRERDGGGSEGVRLPSIHELVRNPWRGYGTERVSSTSLAASVHAPEPGHGPHTPLSKFVYQSEANVSGRPPTPYTVGTVASDVRPGARRAEPEEGAGRHVSVKTAPALRPEAMDMDLDEDDGGAILRSPSLRRARMERDRRELEEIEERRQALRTAIRNAEQTSQRCPTAASQGRRSEEYVPDTGSRGYNKRQTTPNDAMIDNRALEDTRTDKGLGSYGGDEEAAPTPARRDAWSAIPNTKAWRYREEMRLRELQGWDGAREREPLAEREASQAMSSRTRYSRAPTENFWRENESPERPADDGRWDAEMGQKDAAMLREGAAGDDREQDDIDYRHASHHETTMGDWMGAGVGGAVPTVVARDEGVLDIPTTVDNPHDEKWAVHFEDPETLLRGLSEDFIRIVWWGDKPTVIFTVYNYKYTENDAIHRHIETSVTSMTTFLTGETDFKVIPPDPERKHKLQSRDLPFIWAI